MISFDSKLAQISITSGYGFKLVSCSGIRPPAAGIVLMLRAMVSELHSTQG